MRKNKCVVNIYDNRKSYDEREEPFIIECLLFEFMPRIGEEISIDRGSVDANNYFEERKININFCKIINILHIPTYDQDQNSLRYDKEHPEDATTVIEVIPARRFVESEKLVTIDDQVRNTLNQPLVNYKLSGRCKYVFEVLELQTIGDLAKQHRNTILKLRNTGKATIAELEDFLQSQGVQFGMNF